jgi:hypothetical protein
MSYARGLSQEQGSDTEGDGEEQRHHENEEGEWSAGDKLMAQDWLDFKWHTAKVLEVADELKHVNVCELVGHPRTCGMCSACLLGLTIGML